MTEDDAKQQTRELMSAAAFAKVETFVGMVGEENNRQNLIARSTLEHIWARHVLDSAQLLSLAPPDWGLWLDIGSGGGFPGLIVACATDRPVVLAEPRALRASFLERTAAALELGHVSVEQSKVERLSIRADVISARAVASVDKLLQLGKGCATTTTTWLLPRGESAGVEAAALIGRFATMMFHVEQSRSNPGSAIIVARGTPQ